MQRRGSSFAMTTVPMPVLQVFAHLALLVGLLAANPALAQTDAKPLTLDVPYVPTPQRVVDKMLEAAKVRKGDYLIDLGSGDGRIPITAARRFGIRAMGVDLNPERISEAKANAAKAGVSDRVTFVQANIFSTDFSKATVLTLYLLPEVNLKLRPRILAELRPGTRVVSHDFHMGDWKPRRMVRIGDDVVYLWIVPDPKKAAQGGIK
jgi:Methyltransferase domain